MADDLLWDITYKCNLRCQHCYNANRLSSQQETLLDNYQMESIVNKIKNLGIKHIHMLGGEPLCVQVLPDLINELYKEGISISINTNATLLNKSLINIILQKVDQLTISLDGMEADNDLVRGKGVFNIVCRNLYLLTDMKKQLNSKTKLHIAIVANSRNYSTLHKFPQLVSELNVNSIMLMRLYECSDSNIDYSKLRLSNKQYLDILPRFLFNCYKYNIDLKIDCKPSVLDYLKRKMGINIDSQEKFNICQGGGGVIYMDAVGNMYPCSPYSHTENPIKSNIMIDDTKQITDNLKKATVHMNKNKVDLVCKDCIHNKNCHTCDLCSLSDISICREIVNNKA